MGIQSEIHLMTGEPEIDKNEHSQEYYKRLVKAVHNLDDFRLKMIGDRAFSWYEFNAPRMRSGEVLANFNFNIDKATDSKYHKGPKSIEVEEDTFEIKLPDQDIIEANKNVQDYVRKEGWNTKNKHTSKVFAVVSGLCRNPTMSARELHSQLEDEGHYVSYDGVRGILSTFRNIILALQLEGVPDHFNLKSQSQMAEERKQNEEQGKQNAG